MGHFLTIKEELHMKKLYEAGWSEGAIARLYERSRSTVQAALNRQGVQRRPKGMPQGGQRLSDKEFDLTRRLYEQGMSINHIAKLMGRDYRAIHYRLTRAGVKLRTTSEANTLRWQRRGRSAL